MAAISTHSLEILQNKDSNLLTDLILNVYVAGMTDTYGFNWKIRDGDLEEPMQKDALDTYPLISFLVLGGQFLELALGGSVNCGPSSSQFLGGIS